jgi:hypothetical protein
VEEVFVDTPALVALVNRDEGLHKQAVAVNEVLEAERVRLVTTDDVLVELGNLCRKPALRPLAEEAIDAVWGSVPSGLMAVVHVDQELWERGWELFKQRPDKEWSLTDCISFVVMAERNIRRAFTSDHHFEQASFERLLMP